MSEGFSLDVAVVGLSVRLPGARSHREYWDSLMSGRESVTFFEDADNIRDFPLMNNPLYVKACGVLPDFDRFDAGFFGVSRPLAAMMSPEHRQFIESAWEAVEDAGYAPSRITGEVGVYGACNAESIARYKLPPDWVTTSKTLNDYSHGWCPDALAPNVLKFMGLTGEALTLASFCAGFHYSVHFACQSLVLRQSDLCIAGSVYVRVPQVRGYLHEPGGVLSVDGHTRPFDEKGTGSILSSGVVTVVLKRLDDAMRARDHIYGVLKGSAYNNNGHMAIRYGIPNAERLALCVSGALASGEVDPRTVTMLEGFGTGHPLADAIEIDALTRAFRARDRGFCAIGSVKGNIGNCAIAAGGAGTAKALLSLQAGCIPASINCTVPNPQIPFSQTPFFVQRENADWQPAVGVRRAGVSALGGAGYNAHLVLEEAPAPAPPASLGAHVLVTLSAKTPAALTRARHNLREHLRRHPGLALADVAFTLNAGREAWEHRLAWVVRTRDELLERLADDTGAAGTAETTRTSDGCFAGTATPPHTEAPPLTPAGQALAGADAQRHLAAAWTRGARIDWDSYYDALQLRRVSLPSYPFERERFWLESGLAY